MYLDVEESVVDSDWVDFLWLEQMASKAKYLRAKL